MPATNEEFIKKAFEMGLSEDQVKQAVAERNQRLSQNQTQTETPESSPASAIFRILNLPSNFFGGILQEGRQRVAGEYQSPQTGIKDPMGQDIGRLIPPGIAGGVEGVKSGEPTVMEELPKFVGIKPESAEGVILGLAGEVFTPDLVDVATLKYLGKGSDFTKAMLTRFGKPLEEAGEKLVVKGLKPTVAQLRLFKQRTGQELSKFVSEQGISGNFVKKVTEAIEKTQSQFDQIATRLPHPVDKELVLSRVDRLINGLSEGVEAAMPTAPGVVNKLKEYREGLVKYMDEVIKTNGQLTVPDLTKYRRTLDNFISEAEFTKAAMGAEIKPATQIRFAVQEVLQEATKDIKTSSGKNLKTLGKELQKLFMLDEIAQKAVSKGGAQSVFNLRNVMGAILGGTLGGSTVTTLGGAAVTAFGEPLLYRHGGSALKGVGNLLSNSKATRGLVELMLKTGKEGGLQFTK